ncbi:MAG: DUF6950 family protein [Rhabdaerophilum sp.]
MSRLPELERRRRATAKTLAHFQARSFDWRRQATCLHMARFQMKAMGHNPPRLPPLRSALRAKREMDARGFASVTELLDALLPRIAPAEMRLGDLAVIPGDPEANALGLDAVVINVAPRKFAGWHPDSFLMAVMDIDLGSVTAAWRL